ncbi:MAG: DUF3109 family protein [Verrucomicrobia bacterium]|nr:DUF3109 family protein [Cytophagales bacterium]
MLVVKNAYISDDIAEKKFVCDLEKCKGACCTEGELGAPLEVEELETLEAIYEDVAPYLTEAGRKAIAEQGKWVKDFEGDFSTPTVGTAECAYAIYDQQGILKCGIEQAYNEGKVAFKKPISCHLYPVRITKYGDWDAVNYHRWDICDPACSLGESLKVPVYKFLKNALVRKYGEDWYAELANAIEESTQKNP